MDRLSAMSIVIGVAELGSISAASRRIGIPIPTISRKLQDLERRLNVELFQRSTRGLILTEAGRSYVEASRHILNKVAEAERAASREYVAPIGDLTVTAPWGLGHLHLVPATCDFQRAYPSINVRLLLTDRVLRSADGNIDLAIRIGPLQDSNLKAVRLGAIRVVTCASPDYLRTHGVPQTPGDLQMHNCILIDETFSPGAWRFSENGGDVSVLIRSNLIVNTSEAAVNAALAGAGIVRVMLYKMDAAHRAGILATVLDAFELEPLPLYAVYADRNPMPLKLRVFLDMVLPEIRRRLGFLGPSLDAEGSGGS